jgi:predicted small metal-binding protein
MKASGTIHGEKVPRRIPAAIINGEFEVMSNSKDELLNILRKHAPHLVSRAKGMSVSQIQDLIADRLADRTLAFRQDVWEFW